MSEVRAITDWTVFPAWADRLASTLTHGSLGRPALAAGVSPPIAHAVADAAPAFEARLGGARGRWALYSMDQVHGDRVRTVGLAPEPGALALSPLPAFARSFFEIPETDGLVTAARGVLLIVKTADCLPILLIDAKAGVVGACHCGWRGLLAGLAAKTICEMESAGANAARIEAWIGPAICARHYEVNEELLDRFRAAFPGVDLSPGGRLLDLAAAARASLIVGGLREENIAKSGECTFERTDRYPSFRRDGELSGRLLTVIGLP